MKPIKTYHVTPRLPESLTALADLSRNLYWCWRPEVIDLFRRVDRDLWETSGHNPVKLLGEVKQQRLNELALDEGFLAQLRRVVEGWQAYASEQSYVSRACDDQKLHIAYFSLEFGLTECLPIYSGGLGMLAGDHLKSASDLGLPLVAVGLLYQQGYFQQLLNADGWQQEQYPVNDFYNLPMTPCRTADGVRLIVTVEYPTGPVHARVWRVDVGRVPLFLLDTNIPENVRSQDRDITDQLYGGDEETRVRQELMLGVGGLRALDALGLRPEVCHLNEGHAAFLALERVRQWMIERKLSFVEACEATRPGNVFTTHTPVPAGNDRFGRELMEKYFAGRAKELGLTFDQFMGLGRENPSDALEPFCMTVLALKLAQHVNGVSELHGHVSREMWQQVWPKVPRAELPITHITNGVHARSWVSSDMAELFDRYLGPRWADNPMDRAVWERIVQVPDEELWRTHERRRERLVAFARRRMQEQLQRRGATDRQLRMAGEALDPKVLTIGFARRFATYKRATLLLRDLDRLRRILNDPEQPIQIIFAGKAHPRDNQGKELIRQIIHVARQEDLRCRMVFLENYDQNVGRYLVQGVDVWLNTPLRPLEASGTSGMKVVLNGGLNCSIPDGWWPEGYNKRNGWSIGQGESYDDLDYQNEVESSALYDLLQTEIAGLFYSRGSDHIPREWTARMKESMRTLAPVFNTNRMVLDYARQFYLPSGLLFEKMNADESAPAREFAAWRQQVASQWPHVKVARVDEAIGDVLVGDKHQVTAHVILGGLRPEDVTVQAWHGAVDAHQEIANGETVDLKLTGTAPDGALTYTGEIPCVRSGRQGYTIRILPCHPVLENPLSMGLVGWA